MKAFARRVTPRFASFLRSRGKQLQPFRESASKGTVVTADASRFPPGIISCNRRPTNSPSSEATARTVKTDRSRSGKIGHNWSQTTEDQPVSPEHRVRRDTIPSRSRHEERARLSPIAPLSRRLGPDSETTSLLHWPWALSIQRLWFGGWHKRSHPKPRFTIQSSRGP
jgi:hypothetical protein